MKEESSGIFKLSDKKILTILNILLKEIKMKSIKCVTNRKSMEEKKWDNFAYFKYESTARMLKMSLRI